MLKMNEIVTTKIASLWLEDFSAAVRARDYERGLQLFADDVVAFGTYSVILEGLKALKTHQWCHIWDATRNFTFDLGNLRCGGDDNLVWIAALWQSEGRSSSGEWFHRQGRASLVLEQRDGQWVAVHSHHSINPIPSRSFPVGDSR